jgi:hypothetical protein
VWLDLAKDRNQLPLLDVIDEIGVPGLFRTRSRERDWEKGAGTPLRAREGRCGFGDAVEVFSIRMSPTLAEIPYAVQHLATPRKTPFD